MKRICVFAGANIGNSESFISTSEILAKELVNNNIELVYGGAKIGLMGVIADKVLEYGGSVIGVIPKGLMHKEIAHDNLSQLKVVTTMHERKAEMAKLSSAFIALPGGLGTLEEISEIITWNQLGIHSKPCGLLNIDGYYNNFIAHLDHMVNKGFLKPIHRSILIEEKNSIDLLKSIKNYNISHFPNWMNEKEKEEQ